MKFRCSSLGRLMTNGRGKDSLGETAKEYIREAWIKEKYGRYPFISTKPMQKGNDCEEDSLTLYTRVSGDLLIKNEDNLTNEWITGTPDALGEDYVLDIKTPYNIFNFMKNDLSSLYEWQLRGYMMLTDKPRAILAYCLVDMPTEMAERELMYLEGRDYETVEKLCFYSDIPEEERVKTFIIERDLEKEEQIVARVKEARIFAESLTLNNK